MKKTGTTLQHILQRLREETDRCLSGSRLAHELGLSRTAVWKHVQALKKQGYPIASDGRNGYRLLHPPDLLLPGEILPALTTSWLGRSYHHRVSVGSTNEYALSLAAQGAAHGTVVVAEEQTAGRGRLARPWLSPAGCGIYLSMVLTEPLPSRDAAKVTLIAALTLVQSLHRDYGLPAAIKWPNDVLVQGKKVAGILTEMQADPDVVRFLVVGVGINVNQREEDMRGPFRYPASSLALETGHAVRRSPLLAAYLNGFERDYERFRASGFATFLPDLEAVSAVLGKHVTVHCGNEQATGRALGLTAEGALRLEASEGKERELWVGEIHSVTALTT